MDKNMEREKKGHKLTKQHAEILRKYCKGCQMFITTKFVRDICSMVGWYNKVNIDEIVGYVQHCPCNKKCLVKASCREEKCPMWVEYLESIVGDRNVKFKESIK